VVDFHGPMTAFNAERQAKDPAFTLIGSDRVHPGAPGHLLMAWLFLKSQGAPAWISRMEVDAAQGTFGEVFHAEVENLKQTEDELSFTVRMKALPLPVNATAAAVLPMDDFAQDLAREQLAVKHLAPGDYALYIDGTEVGRFSAEEWAQGINTAVLPASPSVRQAQETARINEARRNTEVTLRHFAMVRQFLRRRQIDPDDLKAVAEFAETRMENKNGYIEKQVEPYIRNWGSREEIKARIAELDHSARRAARPKPRVYSLRRIEGR
ncbi:MAG: hypothetical protein U1E27_00135, partial [Kiritimatiellia bacterium]|nr:hypothetical protein [Kiritimatiellia bacterium]